MTEAELRATAEGVRGVALATPLIEAAELGGRCGGRVCLKGEHLQPIGAFKIRGAWTAVRRLTAEQQARGVITHSSGNHGQAVALAGKRAGVRTVVVMPDTAPAIKVEGVRRHGAEIVMVTGPASERGRVAEELAKQDRLVLVAPYENHDVIAGQATSTLEILDAWPEVGTVLVPVGGGGLLAGACAAVRAIRPTTRVIAVEPAGALKLSRALAAGEPVVLDRTASLADGLLAMQIGAIPFGYIQPVVHAVVQVSDDEIAAAVRFLYHSMGLRIEPSGAATVAALLAGRVAAEEGVAAILSGGNIDPDLFARLVA